LPSIVIVSFPIIVFTEDGNGRDAVVPAFVRVFGNPEGTQIVHVMIDQRADTPEVVVIEDAQPGSVEYSNGTDPVVESGRQYRPAFTFLQAEIVSPEA
jgi:hypothetical protein